MGYEKVIPHFIQYFEVFLGSTTETREGIDPEVMKMGTCLTNSQ